MSGTPTHGTAVTRGVDRRFERRLLSVALTLRVAFVLAAYLATNTDAGAWFVFADSPRYIELGRSIAETGTFRYEGVPEIFRMPLYPLLLAAAHRTGHLLLAAIALQIVLSCATVWLTYRLMRATGDERAARIAGYLATADPMLVIYSSLLLTETLFTFVLAAAAYLAVRGDSRTTNFAAGLCAGASALVRPIAYLFPLALAAGVLAARRSAPLGRRVGAAAAILLGGCLTIGVWHVRNAVVLGYPGFSSQIDRALFFTAASGDLAATSGRDFLTVREELRSTVLEKLPAERRDEVAVAVEARRSGLRYLQDNFVGVAREHLRGSVHMLMQPPAGEIIDLLGIESPQRSVARDLLMGDVSSLTARLAAADTKLILYWGLRTIYWMVMIGLILAGTLLIWKRGSINAAASVNRKLWNVVFAVVVYVALVSGTPFADARFRHPLMPFFCLTAAVSLVERINEKRSSGHRRSTNVYRPFLRNGRSRNQPYTPLVVWRRRR